MIEPPSAHQLIEKALEGFSDFEKMRSFFRVSQVAQNVRPSWLVVDLLMDCVLAQFAGGCHLRGCFKDVSTHLVRAEYTPVISRTYTEVLS